MPIGGIISGIGSLAGGIFGSSAASDAAKAQAAATNRAIDLQGQEFQQIMQQLRPFLLSGTTASGYLSDLYGVPTTGEINPSATFLQPISATVGQPPSPTDPNLRNMFMASPGYQYLLQEAQRAIGNQGTVRTGAVSGNTLKALQGNATGLANQDWNDFYTKLVQNYLQRYGDVQGTRANTTNVLANLAGAGQNAATNQGDIGSRIAANTGSLLNTLGSAQAQGIVGSSNALSGGIQNAINALTGGSGGNNPFSFLFGNSGTGTDLTPAAAGFAGQPDTIITRPVF